MTTQLDRIEAVSAERWANEGLFDHQRTGDNTCVMVLCYLLGAGAISDDHLDAALSWLAEADAGTVAHRAAIDRLAAATEAANEASE